MNDVLKTSLLIAISESASDPSNVARIRQVRELLPADSHNAFEHYLLGYLAATVDTEEMTEALTAAAKYAAI